MEKRSETPNEALARLNRILESVRDLLARTIENQKLLHTQVGKLGEVVSDHHKFFEAIVKRAEPPMDRNLN